MSTISIGAEAWLARIALAADDYGNLDGHPISIYTATVGLRLDTVSRDQVAEWLAELLAAGLLEEYTVAGRQYLHVVDFIENQPAGKNGKRFQRVPQPSLDIQDNPGASGGIQVNQDLSQSGQDNPDEAKVCDSNPGVTSQSRQSDKIRLDQIILDSSHLDSPEELQAIEEHKAAIAAFDRWASIKPPIGIARGIYAESNEHKKVIELLDVLRQNPPVLHGGRLVNQCLLVAMAVERLVNRRKEFKGIAYAITTVRGELESWSAGGMPTQNSPGGSSRFNGHQPASAVIADGREDR